MSSGPGHPQSKHEFFLRSSLWDRVRKLTLDPEYIEFDDVDLKSALPTRFLKGEIDALRFGVKGIRGYRFYIGRSYHLDIRNKNNQAIKLRLVSLYGIRVKSIGDKYRGIIKVLDEYYFNDIARKYVLLFRSGEAFVISGVEFDSEGVLFDEKTGKITWLFLGTRLYRTYYILFSQAEPELYRTFEYLTDWNTSLLYKVIEQIRKDLVKDGGL